MIPSAPWIYQVSEFLIQGVVAATSGSPWHTVMFYISWSWSFDADRAAMFTSTWQRKLVSCALFTAPFLPFQCRLLSDLFSSFSVSHLSAHITLFHSSMHLHTLFPVPGKFHSPSPCPCIPLLPQPMAYCSQSWLLLPLWRSPPVSLSLSQQFSSFVPWIYSSFICTIQYCFNLLNKM